MASAPPGLDIAASRSGGRVFLHVANLEFRRSVEALFSVRGMEIAGGRVVAIAPAELREYVGLDQPDVFKPRETALPAGPIPKWSFPPGSVSVVELDLRTAR